MLKYYTLQLPLFLTQECLLVHKKSMRTPHDILIRGDRDGRLSLWKQDRERDISSEGLVECVHTSLTETWKRDNVAIVNEKVLLLFYHDVILRQFT